MRTALPLALLVVAAGCGDEAPVPDYSGLWLMAETGPDYHEEFSRCYLEIEQEGDRAWIKAWSIDGSWQCEGRGEIVEGRLHFRWAGEKKGWRGEATLALHEGGLRGTYRLEGERTETQFCKGARELSGDKSP